MSQNDSAADETHIPEDFDGRDERAVVELYDELQEGDVEWDLSVESDDLTEDEQDRLRTVVYNTIGSYRGIIGRDKFIPSGVYWSLVTDYAEEYMAKRDDEWAEDLTDLEVMAELVMPTEMARYYEADPIANFFALYYSKHKAEGWLTRMKSGHYGTDLEEYVHDEGWSEVLSEMAWCVCTQDVAQKVRAEGHEVNLGPLEYRNDK